MEKCPLFLFFFYHFSLELILGEGQLPSSNTFELPADSHFTPEEEPIGGGGE